MKLTTEVPVVVVILVAVSAVVPGQGNCSWSSLGGGVNGDVLAQVVFDDGTGRALYVGGDFTLAGGAPANYIARWDGTSWSSVGGGMNTVVRALAVFDDGTGPALHAAGDFSLAGGVSVGRIAKWDGMVWSPLGSIVTANSPPYSARISALATLDDGTGPALFVGGRFTTVGGTAANRIAEWKVSWWAGPQWSAVGTGMDAEVSTLMVFDDGSGPALHAAGRFTTAGGSAANRIARWDGAAWSALGSGLTANSAPLSPGVDALEVFDDGSGPALFAGGEFTVAGGTPVGRIARWDGSSWSSLAGGVTTNTLSYTPSVASLEVFDDGSGPALFVGGDFTGVAGPTVGAMPVSANRIARWDGSSWSAVGVGLTNPNLPGVLCGFVAGISFPPCPAVCRSLAVMDDGTGPSLYAGGDFSEAGGAPAGRIATWSCGSTIGLSATQASAGAPVFVNNVNLTPGNEYYNLFSFDLCPAGVGTGPVATFGACVFMPANVASVVGQLMSPVGTAPFHVIAPSSHVNWGPYAVGPMTVDAICIDVTGGVIGPVSPVVRITVQ